MTRTKILTATVFCLALIACKPDAPEKPVLMNGAKAGEFCGGIAGIACAEGLRCRLDGNYPDAGGTCVEARK